MTRRSARWAAAGVLGLHAVIHLVGFLLLWRIAEIGDFTYDVAVPVAGTASARAVGAGWLGAAVLFCVASAWLASGSTRWAGTALAGAALSTPVLLLNVGETLPGVAVNLVLVALAARSLAGPPEGPARDAGSVDSRLSVTADPGVFDESELAGLPEPVARYFRAAIAPGAPLARAAVLDMRGSLKLNRRWLPMRAKEVLAPHQGFVWRARVAGAITGADLLADGRGAMNWMLFGRFPVVSSDGPDVARSAVARAAGEAVWLPTALLPRFGVRWEAPTDQDLIARFAVEGTDVAVHLRIDGTGRVQWVRLDRWGDPDDTGRCAIHPFGFQVTATRTFGPYTIPSAGSVGWFHGTDGWDRGEFFRCAITALDPVTAREQPVRHTATSGVPT